MKWAIAITLLTVLPMIAVAQPVRTTKWTLFSFAHPDAKLLLGMDWRKILSSPLGPVMQRQINQGGNPLFLFMESIENMDRLLVSSPGGTSEEGQGAERPPLLVVGEGRFALARIREMAKADGAVARRYNGVELLVPPDATNGDLHFALVDAQTILFGDGNSVKQAIDRWQRGDQPGSRNQMFARAARLAENHEAWAVVEDPADSLRSLGMGDSLLAEHVEGLEFAVSFGQTMTATVRIEAPDEEASATLADGLPALLQLLAFQYSKQPSLTALARSVKVMKEGSYIKLGMTADARLLERSMNELRASTEPPALPKGEAQARFEIPTLAQVAPTLAAPPPPPVQRVIRITGGMDGDKAIPFGNRQ
ncbi:MAG: hypothetical protein HYZ37_00785 [Candidatus Solibacter usitatus]|nr:hypothetical protein [Candidatus Solibacter usitatus]